MHITVYYVRRGQIECANRSNGMGWWVDDVVGASVLMLLSVIFTGKNLIPSENYETVLEGKIFIKLFGRVDGIERFNKWV